MGLFSSITSLFKKKKDEQNYTPATSTQNMSYANQSNPYVSSNLFSSASTSSTPKLDLSKYNFFSTPTSASSATVNKTTTSPNSGYQKLIHGSGYGSGYAINDTMSPAEVAKRNQQVLTSTQQNNAARAPQTTVPNLNNTKTTGTTMADLFKMQGDANLGIANRSKQTATDQNQAYIDQITGSYNRANQTLLNQIPYLQEQSDLSKQELLDAAETIRKSGEIQKDSTEEYYGDALRQGAQTGREQEQKLKNLFAGLGTLDSSQFKNEMINTTEETTRGQQQTLRAKARELSSIEATVQEAERKAQLAVQQEVSKFNETIRQINETVYNNDQAKEEDIRAAYTNLQSVLDGIDETLTNNQLLLEQKKYEYQQEELKLAQSKPGYGLSEEFMNTGVPQTAEEEYILKQGETAAQNIIAGFMTLDNIEDPNIKAIAQDIISQSGATAGSGSSGKVAAKDLNIAQTGIDDVSQLRQMFVSNPYQAKTTKIPLAGQTYDNLINNLTDKIGRLRSGGAINKEEEARFKELLPTFWDTANTIEFKLNQLEREFQGLAGMA